MNPPAPIASVPAAPAALAGRIASRRPRVVVIGDALLDGWLAGPAQRVGRDAPVPVVELAMSATAAGGAANVAVALGALGVDVELITVFGDDPDGLALRRTLHEHGVRTERSVIELGRPTPAKRRLLAAGQPIARYDVTPDRPPRGPTQLALVEALTEAVCRPHRMEGDRGRIDAVVVADYGLGVLTSRVRRRLARLRPRIPLLAVDAHVLRPWAAIRPDVVTPSALEAAALLGEPVPVADRVRWATARHRDLVRAGGGADVVVTLDVDGVVRLPGGDEPPGRHAAARRAPEVQACGAGDTFVATYTAASCAGAEPAQALAAAQAAADVVVDLPRTAVCTSGALAARLAACDRGRVLDHRDLVAVIDEHRRAGHRVVFTNGCFDVLHRGHVAYLRQARELGDVLVVALNSDASVARLKGPQRPVNPLEDRAGVVGALDGVDLVTAFEADSPVELLELLRPEVYAKGGDYTPQMLPETPVVERLGGEVRVLDYLSDHSTSAIVARIRTAPTGGSAR
ncbi:D-glycero-beta-D-manno-heptose 1-phosphate adenylyltransferase [Pseudonocardia bannensis]|uniref:D-glycero-beta-D-manno-heptose 1-phosphate adenylyltransferase n=2 Tax=Pseudonocardia bannensis TaxID=630973 RepID=A0A848DAR3_9PSEU|nr:D-glycero-beta-D-manno-heptose 1-phosphate adenylyltransferase [Pseudonocardia bannensis]